MSKSHEYVGECVQILCMLAHQEGGCVQAKKLRMKHLSIKQTQSRLQTLVHLNWACAIRDSNCQLVGYELNDEDVLVQNLLHGLHSIEMTTDTAMPAVGQDTQSNAT